jgi:hypothetical protein
MTYDTRHICFPTVVFTYVRALEKSMRQKSNNFFYIKNEKLQNEIAVNFPRLAGQPVVAHQQQRHHKLALFFIRLDRSLVLPGNGIVSRRLVIEAFSTARR